MGVYQVVCIKQKQYQNIGLPMRTKTKELLMQKLQQNQQAQPSARGQTQQSIYQNPVRLPKRHPSHISHVNQYNFFCIVNKKPPPQGSLQHQKQLQIQNLRLMEQNINLTEWSHNMLNKLKHGLIKAIKVIEEFRYLEGVNLLHSFLREINQDNFDLGIPKRLESVKESVEVKRELKGYTNPESKRSLLFDFKQMEMCPLTSEFTFFPHKKEVRTMKEELTLPFIVAHDKNPSPSKRFKDDSGDLLRMLLAQSMSLQTMIDPHQDYD